MDRPILTQESGLDKPDAAWAEALTAEQYRILRQGHTERPFTGEYVHTDDNGSYRCAACQSELFSSDAKFDSRTGWPSFAEPAVSDAVELKADRSLLMQRTEVLCRRCGGHLGHVFDDGPGPAGQRYCINSGALDFKPGPKADLHPAVGRTSPATSRVDRLVGQVRHGEAQVMSSAARSSRWTIGVRLVAATVFLIFGAGKFVSHASELASFRAYGLPAPGAFVYAIGVLEIAGGLLLAIGLQVRPAAAALAGNMLGAILLSGVGRGETVSLTLAPAMLVAMIFLIGSGAGGWSLDRRLANGRSGSSGRSTA